MGWHFIVSCGRCHCLACSKSAQLNVCQRIEMTIGLMAVSIFVR